ncbi:hypothetical protein LTR16_000740 [Cryomyces antarcticus]|uniref:Uncharacterized protein n=1 Tax=Cryomyces antarcticus TaxID=329879 RepID=A0ABR0KUE2_9PEZI|nr:hypothetical protein LTR60_001769 [Cryomyces antarcticus]KAK5019824.1 hypothetical protein LTR39_000109 [Cryomyces antarcticus]KAK5131471.1 hypothetical protein LTR16_000740 [Cryomyces antarcticus]
MSRAISSPDIVCHAIENLRTAWLAERSDFESRIARLETTSACRKPMKENGVSPQVTERSYKLGQNLVNIVARLLVDQTGAIAEEIRQPQRDDECRSVSYEDVRRMVDAIAQSVRDQAATIGEKFKNEIFDSRPTIVTASNGINYEPMSPTTPPGAILTELYSPNNLAVEDPRDPPATAIRVPSPLPEANRRHAGSTPPRPLRPVSVQSSPILDSPTRANTELNAAQVAAFEIDQVDGSDEDPPLKGPLALRSIPEDYDRATNALFSKLTDIEEHPEEAVPSVLRNPTPAQIVTQEAEYHSDQSALVSQRGSEQENVDHDVRMNANDKQANDSAITSPYSAFGSQNSPGPPSAPSYHDGNRTDGFPRLKKKPSINFGAPVGQLTQGQARFHRESSEDKIKRTE